MHPNAKLIETFYSSFQKLDHAGMIACYHENIQFSDPVFQDLRGEQAGAMWHMLCSRAKDFELTFSNVTANDTTGSAHWEPIYLFSATGRRVHNVIDAEFEFQDGKIIRHRDTFDLWRWSRMALGPMGQILGWTPLVQNKVRKQAAYGLKKFLESQKKS